MSTTTARLGRHLMTLRSLVWMTAELGDPYARLLRGERVPVPAGRSALGPHLVTDPAAVTALAADPRLAPRHPGPPGAQAHPVRDSHWNRPVCHVLPLPSLNPSRAELDRLTGLAAAVTVDWAAAARSASARLAGALRGPGPVDLLAAYLRPAAAAALAELLDLPAAQRAEFTGLCRELAPAADAVLCPPPLPSAVRLLAAGARLDRLVRALPATPTGLTAELLRAGADPAAVVLAVTSLAVTGTALAADAAAARLCGRVPLRLAHLVCQRELPVSGVLLPEDSAVVLVEQSAVPSWATGLAAAFAHAQAEAAVAVLRERFPAAAPARDPAPRPDSPATGAFLELAVLL